MQENLNPLQKRGFRLLLMLIDHFTMSLAGVVIMMPSYIILIVIYGTKVLGSDNQSMMFVFCLVYSVYFNKDIFAGRSIGKRALKYQVVVNETGIVANPYRCLVRNLLLIIWPIEIIVSLINPSRKIGDFIAGTKIIHTDIPQDRKTSKR